MRCHEWAANQRQTVMIVTCVASDREYFGPTTINTSSAICFQWREA